MPDKPLALDPGNHWLVPFAALGPSAEAPALPHLEALLRALREVRRDNAGETTYAMPHERAWAQARGLALAPDAWPGAALQSDAPTEAQAWVHPVHLQAGMDQVTLQPAELFDLDTGSARRLFEALAPLCEEDGVRLHFDHPTRWRASGERLRALRCASLDRVSGRSIAPWLPQGDEARWLQRLMSEAQMLFYTHPVNDAREAARQLPVNGVWVSAAGALPAGQVLRPAPQVVEVLRTPALQGDAPAWRAAWQALDAGLIAELGERARRAEPLALTLCGERASATFITAPPSPWRRLSRLLGAPRSARVPDLLSTL